MGYPRRADDDPLHVCLKDGAWREVGDRIMPGKEPVRFFEMNLERVGDTSWPAAGAISPK